MAVRTFNLIRTLLDRVLDWLAVIGYALHNIFFAMSIEAGASRLGDYLTERGISPLWTLLLLMLGLVWSASLWLHWKIRIYGTIPLAITGIFTIAVYFADNAPIRTIFGIVGLYYSLAAMPIIVMILYGRLNDVLKRADELEHLTHEQNQKLITYESKFATGQNGTARQ